MLVIKSIKSFLEKVAYQGLKPGQKASPLGSRSPSKLIYTVVLVVVPIVAVATGFWFVRSHRTQPSLITSNVRTLAPNELIQPIQSATNQDVELTELRVDFQAKPPLVMGIIKNRSGHGLGSVDVTFNVVDREGSLIGRLRTEFKTIETGAVRNFTLKADYPERFLVMIGEVNTVAN